MPRGLDIITHTSCIGIVVISFLVSKLFTKLFVYIYGINNLTDKQIEVYKSKGLL